MDEITPVKTKFRLVQWTQLIQDQQASGLSIKVWCQQTQIKEISYYYWLKRVRKQALSSEMFKPQRDQDEPVAFARLPVNLERTNRNVSVVINFPSATVKIMDGAAPETIEAVLQAMKVLC
jgi:hypothetical protein